LDLSKKLQVPNGKAVFLVDPPRDFGASLRISRKQEGAAVLAFAANSRKLRANARAAIETAKADGILWIAYPKAGQLDSDLNRDLLQKRMRGFGIEGVRLVSIDEVWSAMRFRPSRSAETQRRSLKGGKRPSV